MPQFNGDVTFIDASGQVISLQEDLTARASSSGNVIIGFPNNLRPEIDIEQDLGLSHLRWRNLFASGINNNLQVTSSGYIPVIDNELNLGSDIRCWANSYITSGHFSVITSHGSLKRITAITPDWLFAGDVNIDGQANLLGRVNVQNNVFVSGSLQPFQDCVSNLGNSTEKWATIYACNIITDRIDTTSGVFNERPTVNGSGVLLQGEAAGVSAAASSGCITINFLPSDGIDINLTHGLGTEDFTWSLWRTDTTPNTTVIPTNIAPVDLNTLRLQLTNAMSGKLVVNTCGGDTSSGIIAFSSASGAIVDEAASDASNALVVANAALPGSSGALIDQALDAANSAFPSTSGAIVDNALNLASNALPGTSGSILRISDGIAEYYLSSDTGSFTTTLTPVPFDTTVFEDEDYYSRSGGTVTILSSGIYKVSFSSNTDQIGGNGRSTCSSQITRNGSNLVPQSIGYGYSRFQGGNGRSTVSKTFFIRLDLNDTLEVETVRTFGNATFEHMAGSNLSLEFIRYE